MSKTRGLALGAMFSTGVMWLLGDVIRTQERATRRESVLAAVASRLHQAETHESIYAIAVDAALELVEDVPDSAVSLWRGDPTVVRVGGFGGGVPDDLPVEIPLDVLPDDVRRSLLSGDPFVLGEDAARLVQQAVEVESDFLSVLVVPLTHGSTFAGALVLASHQPLPEELTGPFGRLGGDVALALDRADSTVLLRRVVDNSSDAILLLDADLTVDRDPGDRAGSWTPACRTGGASARRAVHRRDTRRVRVARGGSGGIGTERSLRAFDVPP